MHLSFHKTFKKQLKKAPKLINQQLEERLHLFVKNQNDPILNNHKLLGMREGQRSINISGDWRAIYEELGNDIMHFLEIGTHDSLYRK